MFGVRPAAAVAALALSACAPQAQSAFTPVHNATAISNATVSWMRAAAHSETLLYVSDAGGVTVYADSGGNTFTLAGELFGFQTPAGECTDSRGDVFIADENARAIDEYAHGAITPKAVIADDLGQPLSCAIDRKTGRLAVTNFSGTSGVEPGNVAIYPSLSSKPVEYTNPTLYVPLFCAFDRKGDLYVDAYDSGYHGVLSELPNGSGNFTILSLSGGTLNIPSGLLVNGSQLLLGEYDDTSSRIYQVTVRHNLATVVGTVPLSKTHQVAQFSLLSSGSSTAVLAPDNEFSNVEIYSFPGGAALGAITDHISQPVGTALSE